MKKLKLFVVILLVFCFLCACDPATYVIDWSTLDNVVSVELIEYKNLNQKHFTSWVPDQFNELVPFYSANATVLETLPEEKIPDFLNAFSETDILHTYYAYDSPKDICLRLNYENGDFLIIWANYTEDRFAGYIGEYGADGTVLSFWGSFSALQYYEDLVEQYFDYTLK